MRPILMLLPVIAWVLVSAGCCAPCNEVATTEVAASEDPLFPLIEPYDSGMLQVSDLHQIYYEQVGNPEGEPVMVLHGGPGVGSYPRLRQYCDPARYRIVIHDQRGAGLSQPAGELQENTTQDLVADIEQLRTHLGLGKVVLFGGSWGSTLALAYAETYPEQVRGMVLRGLFLATSQEIDFHYFGTRRFFPDAYDRMVTALPEPERGPDPAYLNELIRHGEPAVAGRVVDALGRFEMTMGALQMPEAVIEQILEEYPATVRRQLFLIDLHYVTNGYFLEENQLLRDAKTIGDIPVFIINGRYDMLCPPENAFALHQQLPGSQLILVGDAGHSEREPGITAALVKAMNEMP